MLNKLAEKYNFEMPRAEVIGNPSVPEKLDYWAEFKIDGHEIILAMDWFKCSIASPNQQVRDAIFDVLSKPQV